MIDYVMGNYIEIFYNLRYHSENEVVEFKEAKESFDIDTLGKYFSALSNEANLRRLSCAWIVFGIQDKTRKVVGTKFKSSEAALHKLKNDMSQHTTGGLIFRDIAEVVVDEDGIKHRVLIFKIPASPHNIVTCWKGIAYGRKGESLTPLDQAKQDEIRNQPPQPDWSEQIVEDATLNDLDPLAMAKARIEFAKVHANIGASEIKSWSDEEFLVHCGIMNNGKLTRAALILLGKPLLASAKLRPAVAEVTWILKDAENDVVDYKHFGPPFILTVDDVLKQIRNLTMREMPGGTLFPDTMQQYDDYCIREALNNCLAHQDYTLEQRVNFVEREDSLYYENGGTFAPETVENVLEGVTPQRYYRNRCLCEAMYHMNMIDKVGRGIKKIYRKQLERHFPMPDYVIDNDKKVVSVVIYGKAIDDKYTALLKECNALSLKECIWLDAIQKKRPVTADAIKELKAKKLIEGKAHNYVIALSVAKQTHQLAHYTKEKGLEKGMLIGFVLQLAKNAGKEGFKRADAFDTLVNSLPVSRSISAKERIVGHLLGEMAHDGLIEARGKTWYITPKGKSNKH